MTVVGRCAPGNPRAVLEQKRPEFWVREGSSKRFMTYSQIEAHFHGNKAAERQARIDAEGTVAIAALRARLEAHQEPEAAMKLIEELFQYTERPYSKALASEIVSAAKAYLGRSRLHYRRKLLNRALDLISATLPIEVLNAKQYGSIDADDLAGLEQAAHVAHDLIYDATRRHKDLWLVSMGGRLLHDLLRFATWNELATKADLEAMFEERIQWAKHDLPPVGASLLRFYRDHALDLIERVPMPDDVSEYAFRHTDEEPEQE